jgi:hypothetical protein
MWKRKEYIFHSLPKPGGLAEASQSLFSHICGEVDTDPAFALSVIWDIPRCYGVGKSLKKTHTWSSSSGVRTRDLPNVKWRARRLTTVLGSYMWLWLQFIVKWSQYNNCFTKCWYRFNILFNNAARSKSIWMFTGLINTVIGYLAWRFIMP